MRVLRTGVLTVFLLAVSAIVIALLRQAGTPPSTQATHQPLSGEQIVTAVLDAGHHPDFDFETDRVNAAGGVETVARRTPLSPTDAIGRARQDSARRILFFLPGFNTSFAHGAADAAWIAKVLDRQTFLVYTDWGSQGKALAYRRDGRAAQRNAAAFAHLLEFAHAALPNGEIDIFAHSMGSRVAIRGLALIAQEHKQVAVRHLVLAAPDITIGDYISAMHRLANIGRASIYVSRRDKALLLSALIHFHRRLGQVTVERWNLPRTDVIDVSAEDHTKSGHGYALHDESILNDIYQIVASAPSPHRNWCRSKKYSNVWLFVPGVAKLPVCPS